LPLQQDFYGKSRHASPRIPVRSTPMLQQRRSMGPYTPENNLAWGPNISNHLVIQFSSPTVLQSVLSPFTNIIHTK